MRLSIRIRPGHEVTSLSRYGYEFGLDWRLVEVDHDIAVALRAEQYLEVTGEFPPPDPPEPTTETRLTVLETRVDGHDGDISALTAEVAALGARPVFDPATSVIPAGHVMELFSAPHVWTAGQAGAFVPAASVMGETTIDMAAGNNFFLSMTEHTTLTAPAHPMAGQSGVVVFQQSVAAGLALAFDPFWTFLDLATPPAVTDIPGAYCLLSYIVLPDTSGALCFWAGS